MSFAELQIPEERINSVIYLDEMANIFGIELDFDYDDPQTAFEFTQMAVNIHKFGQNTSYPVGCVYWGIDENDRKFFVPCVNTIPQKIKDTLDEGEEHIAGSHATAHAEMVGLNIVPPYKKLSEATDKSPCPTCMEGLCELSNTVFTSRRIDAVYFDNASLEGDKAQELWEFSSKMLKPIAQNGRVGLIALDLKNKEIAQTIAPIPKQGTPKVKLENPIEVKILEGITSFDQINTQAILAQTKAAAKSSTIPSNQEATTLILEHEGEFYAITAAASLPPGFKASESMHLLNHDLHTKKRSYLFQEDSLKRCKVTAKAMGLNTNGSMMICTQIPKGGMMINATLYGVDKLITKNKLTIDFDKEGHKVLLELTGYTGKPAIIKHEAANDSKFAPNTKTAPDKLPELLPEAS